MFEEITETAKLTWVMLSRSRENVRIMCGTLASRIVLLSYKCVKVGWSWHRGPPKVLSLQAELFPDQQPLPSLYLQPLVGKPHHCSSPSHRRDSRMDPLFTQTHMHTRGTGTQGWDVVALSKCSLLLNCTWLKCPSKSHNVKFFFSLNKTQLSFLCD